MSTSREGNDVVARIGDAAAFKQTDVSDTDQVQELIDFAVDRFGGLDIMFNNAGIGSSLKRFLRGRPRATSPAS